MNAAKFREKYGNTQDLQRLIKMYSSSLQNVEDELKNLTNLSADAYFLNNPFQINKDANSIKLAYMRGILLVIEKVEGLTKVEYGLLAESIGGWNQKFDILYYIII